jgi:hypothetical protein
MRYVFVALIGVCALQLPLMAQQPADACPVTPTVQATSPRDTADPVRGDWYRNEDESIWVAVPRDGWPAGGEVYRGNQVISGQ